MALIKFGGGITEMRGSIGGTTFSRNRYGAIARNRTKPVNPNTALQQAARTSLTEMTTRWSQTLTAVQRAAWNLYGTSVAMVNKLGETIYLTGFNHYVRSNSFLARFGLTNVDAGPVVFELPAADPALSIAVSEATQQITVTFDDTMAWCSEDDAYMEFLLGQPQNPQRNFFAGPYKGVRFLAGDVGVPLVSPQILNGFYAMSELQRMWVSVRIRRADGRLSQPFRDDAFIGA